MSDEISFFRGSLRSLVPPSFPSGVPVLKHVALLLLVLALSIAPAGAAPVLTVGAASGAPGEQVEISISLVNDSNVTAVGFDVLFDASQVAAVGAATAGPVLATTDHEVHSNVVSEGRFRILVVSPDLLALPDGVIVTVPFTLAEEAESGTSVALSLSDVEMVRADATIAEGSTVGGSISVEDTACPVPGDVAPDGVGDGAVSLLDFVVARRKAIGTLAQGDRDALCGNVGPGTVACTPGAGKISFCPAPNDTGNPITLIDVVIIRRLALKTHQIACVACETREAAPARVAGDVAPRGRGDGRLDIGDVVLALRACVGLDEMGSDASLADVAPGRPAEGAMLAEGDGTVDVGDVVLLLRAAVGLERLEWPERELEIRIGAPEPRVASALRVTGWPGHATPLRVDSGECPGEDAGLEVARDRWGMTCVSDPAVVADAGVLATVTYVGPRVPVPALGIESSVLSPDGREVDGLLSIVER